MRKSVLKKVRNQIQPPVQMGDYSFMKLVGVADIIHELPRNLKEKRVGAKYNATVIKLNNNLLTSVQNIMDYLSAILKIPEALTWIDLSFNALDKIDPVFSEFPSLQILYLHGNRISDPAEIFHLVPCPMLKKLALHGNPLESVKNYRFFVLSILPGLRNFDMSTVTKMDLHVARNLYAKPLTENDLRAKRSSRRTF